MKSIMQPAAREELVARFRTLRPERERRWGRMTADQMVAHVSDFLRLAVRDIPANIRDAYGIFSRFPLKQVAIFWMPWPKGKIKGPREVFTTAPGVWESDLRELERLIERTGTVDAGHQWPRHPIFGTMSHREWGVLSYRHLDHHLRQFGG